MFNKFFYDNYIKSNWFEKCEPKYISNHNIYVRYMYMKQFSFSYFLVNYQMEMMRRLRAVNIDHLHVGWYQSTYLGSYINKTLLDSQHSYQKSIEESVVLIYGKVLSAFGA